MADACISLWQYGDKPTTKWETDERYRYPMELWAEHLCDAQVFFDNQGQGVKLVRDIDSRAYVSWALERCNLYPCSIAESVSGQA